MPKAKLLDTLLLSVKLRTILAAREPLSAKELADRLAISQASFSRVINGMDGVRRFGKGKGLRYTLKREIFRVDPELKVYEIDKNAKPKTLGNLQPVTPKGFLFQKNDSEAVYYNDLPYFLEDMKPSGFLGRIVPKKNPEMNWPADIQTWSSDDAIQYLANLGWNSVGNLIIGNSSLAKFLQRTETAQPIKPSQRKKHYLDLTKEALEMGPPGSSAGGEQPKFLADFESGKSVIVKFSPSTKKDRDISQRFSDLLYCEHIALDTLSKNGIESAKTRLFRFDDRSFLEIERFDRTTVGGRRGLISLRALSMENGYSLSDAWYLTCEKLNINRTIVPTIRRLYFFGQMIQNTDMHYGNLSFYFEELKIVGLAPTYDMLPMALAPERGEIINRQFSPPLPTPETFEDWEVAHDWAQQFWDRAKKEKFISSSFRKIAETSIGTLEKAFRSASVLK